MCDRTQVSGYDEGVRLIAALLVRLRRYCQARGIELPKRNFRIEVESTIPSGAGLGAESAINTAALRAVSEFYGIRLPLPDQAKLVWEAEYLELGKETGPIGPISQVYEGFVFVDARWRSHQSAECGFCERMDARLGWDMYVAYRRSARRQGHRDLVGAQSRAEDAGAAAAITTCGALAWSARQAVLDEDREEMHRLIDANLNLRMHMGDLSDEDVDLARIARAVGASANVVGRGGAIVGLYEGTEMIERMRVYMEQRGVRVERVETDASARSAD